jgi:hypothetical protein
MLYSKRKQVNLLPYVLLMGLFLLMWIKFNEENKKGQFIRSICHGLDFSSFYMQEIYKKKLFFLAQNYLDPRSLQAEKFYTAQLLTQHGRISLEL